MMERLIITGAGSEMQGVGRLADGRAVFVPGALPGEEVEIEITRDAGRFCEATLLRVLAPSPMRAESPCPVYSRCGGCSARHMTYAYTLELKRQRVFDALKRIGGIEQPQVLETIGSACTQRMRNKAEYAVQVKQGKTTIGSYAPRSRQIVPLTDCLLQKEPSVHALQWLGENLARYPFAGQIRYLVTRVNRAGQLAMVLSGDAPIQAALRQHSAEFFAALPELISLHFCRLKPRPAHALDGECSLTCGSDTMQDTLLGLRFELSPQSFFQVNPEQTEILYTKALEAAMPNGSLDHRILDVYCGAGTITLAAAERASFAVGVELVPPAIENARRNAKMNGLEKKTRFICGDAAREIPRLIASGERFGAAIIDPPRKGADERVLGAMAHAGLPRIAYVSCNPSTLARDVKFLAAQGYRLEWAQPVDMFPWSEHVETVASLVKES